MRALKLTAREEAVLAAIARGLASAQIASQLGMAPATVKRHREHLRVKLGLRTAAELAAWHARHRGPDEARSPKPTTRLAARRAGPRVANCRCWR
ncbi:MAG: helix-turn-helix transcriptional regulator [Methylotenera sp.]|nr:helix-turn-helix transcriptional regulator [Methylotenera sp.]